MHTNQKSPVTSKVSTAILSVIAAFVLAILTLSAPATALATSDQECTTGDCQFKPAIKVVTPGETKTKTITTNKTSKTTSKSVETIKSEIKTYEQKHKVRIVVNVKPGGVPSQKGCVDPTKGKTKWIKPNEKFYNSGANIGAFPDTWDAGRKICNAKRVKFRGATYMRGRKDNCDNVVWIRVNGKKIKEKVVKTIEVPSYEEALKVITTESESNETSNGSEVITEQTPDKVSYVCEEGWQLIDGNMCKYCPPPTCKPVEKPKYGKCTGLKAEDDLTRARSFRFTVSVEKQNLEIDRVEYNFGDNKPVVSGGTSITRQYDEYKSYSVIATVYFSDGSSSSKDCTATVTTKKDGTTTPTPPPSAPGPNPTPSPQDPVGSNKCYSESTGLPVSPRSDGTCPAGSYGA